MLLVTGANGHTARFFFDHLSRVGHAGPIRAVFRAPERAEGLNWPELDIEAVFGDLNDAAFLERALAGVDTVLHIAGIHFSPAIVDVGTRAGVGWFILVHTTARYSKFRRAFEDYVAIEDRLIAEHDTLTILRPTMIYGSHLDRNMWKLIRVLDRTRVFPVFGSGRNLMQPVHAADLAKAYHAVLEERAVTYGKEYNLPGREPLGYGEVLRLVARALRRRIWFVAIPMGLSRRCVRLSERWLGARSPVIEEQVLRLNEDKAFDWSDAARDFGYDPMRFEDGIALEVAEYRQRNVG